MSNKSMKKKILMICNHFAPDNSIAAIRTTKLAKYFVKNGCDVLVIAEKKYDAFTDSILARDAEGIRVIYAENSEQVKEFLNRYKESVSDAKEKRFNKLDDRIRINPKTGKKEFYTFQAAYPLIASLDYIAEAIRQYDLFLSVRDKLDRPWNADCLITSYGDLFSYFAGRYFNEKHRRVPWIFDLRDAICLYKFTPVYMQPFALSIEKDVWKRAARIVGVSAGICRRVPTKYRRKVHCITNGYDLSDRDGIKPRKDTDKMVFSYTGSMYGGAYDLSPFFRCLAELSESGEINTADITVRYAGNAPAYEIFRAQADKYGVGDCCEYMGKLERTDSLRLQSASDVLLVASFDYKTGYCGVVTGKALEYMSADKPIISLMSGDVLNNQLSVIIDRGRLGFSYEEASAEEDFIGLKEYILGLYSGFKRSGAVPFDPDKEYIKRFDYRYLSKKYMKIINELTQRK